MPREVDGLTDDIDELVDYQLTASPAALKHHVASPVVASAGLAQPHTTRETP